MTGGIVCLSITTHQRTQLEDSFEYMAERVVRDILRRLNRAVSVAVAPTSDTQL